MSIRNKGEPERAGEHAFPYLRDMGRKAHVGLQGDIRPRD